MINYIIISILILFILYLILIITKLNKNFNSFKYTIDNHYKNTFNFDKLINSISSKLDKVYKIENDINSINNKFILTKESLDKVRNNQIELFKVAKVIKETKDLVYDLISMNKK